MWSDIEDVITKTMLMCQPVLATVYSSCFHSYNGGFSCFELLGFDVMLDDAYKVPPQSLSSSSSSATSFFLRHLRPLLLLLSVCPQLTL